MEDDTQKKLSRIQKYIDYLIDWIKNDVNVITCMEGILIIAIVCSVTKKLIKLNQQNVFFKWVSTHEKYCFFVLFGITAVVLLHCMNRIVRSKNEWELRQNDDQIFLETNDSWSEDQIASKIKKEEGNADLWKQVNERMGEWTEDDISFRILLVNVYIRSLKKRKRNKEAHFKNKYKAARYNAARSIIEKVYNQRTVIAGFAGVFGTGILKAAGGLIDSEVSRAFVAVFLFFLIIGLIIFIYFQGHKFSDEIEIRRYSETWVRHEALIYGLQNEMIQYISNLGEYSSMLTVESGKKLFMQNILKVLERNEQRFQKNMEE